MGRHYVLVIACDRWRWLLGKPLFTSANKRPAGPAIGYRLGVNFVVVSNFSELILDAKPLKVLINGH